MAEADLGGGDEGADAGNPEVEREARSMGWAPLEQWRGRQEDWKDAAAFVEHGRTVLPILQANNRKLLGELEATKQQLAGLKGTVDAQTKTMKDLLEHQASEIKRQVTDRLKDLKADRLQAIEDGDHKRAAALEDQIEETKEALTAVPKATPGTTQADPPAPPVEPWAKEFAEANADWLGPDKRKTGLFAGICDELFANTNLRGTALLEEGKKQMETYLAGKPRASKSESGGGSWSGAGGNGGGGTGGGDYAALPAEAKAVCDRQADKFVGKLPGIKTKKDWQAYYAKTHFESQGNQRR